MTSSMLSGDRRWTSGRRGMTVLGKVAVPKPINLPSQRLENHGLDPNVELVPKGSLSWGSKSSSSSNAWGSSTLSPKKDGDSVSPSYLSARPSSGGSGTRPSTAGSERGQETANLWGSSSRPSSASGSLTSNQSSNTSLRPRSAETRPGSSHLSRFAEPVIDSTAAWATGGPAEKLGVVSSKNDGFSLASGDFPSLGSERDASGRTTGSRDRSPHSRPGSSSGKAVVGNERIGASVAGDIPVDANTTSGSPNSWRKENLPYNEDGIRPNVERWHADNQGPHPYPHTGIPPPHYDAWHASVNNHPSGVWFRGPPGGPPYGSPVPPRGFPLEPYPPYYRPQLPGNTLPNPPPVPPPGAGPRGHHPRNGDMYRPPMADGYVHPVMPIRPGFYPGPVGYDSYYCPPMGYCSSTERDVQIMGVAAGPSPYNRHPSQNVLDAGGSHARPSGHGPANKMASEQVDSEHPHDAQRPYKVLLKQQEGRDAKEEQHKWDKTIATGAVMEGQSRSSPWETDWKGEQEKVKEMNLKMVVEETSYQSVDSKGGSFLPAKFKSSEGMQNMTGHDDSSVKSAECPNFPEVHIKDVTLIQKIEGLNAKARASGGQYEGTSSSSRDEQKNISSFSVTEAAPGSGVVYPDKLPACPGMTKPTSDEVGASVGDKSGNIVAAGGAIVTRRSTHGRTDNRGRGRFVSQEADGWRKRQQVLDAPNVKSAAHAESSSAVDAQECSSSEAAELSVTYFQLKGEGELVPPVLSPNDNQAQRAMMRELAKQRVKQRQREEEEREKDQKAKALAKLEELNRRTLVESQSQKLGATDVTHGKLEEVKTPTEEMELAGKLESSVVGMHFGGDGSNVVEKPELFSEVNTDTTSRNARKEVSETHEWSAVIQMSTNNTEAGPLNTVQQASSLKQKRMGYRQKNNIPRDEAFVEKTTSNSIIESHKVYNGAVVNVDPSSEISHEIAFGSEPAVSQNTITEPSGHQRKKTNRNGKNKHRVDEASASVLPDGIPKEMNPGKISVEGQQKSPEVAIDPSLVQSMTESKGAESHAQMNNSWKNQHPKRMPRNQQAHRSAEKFHSNDSVMWAPVRSLTKADAAEEMGQKIVAEVVPFPMKSDIQVQNNTRNKRAEMERYVPKPVAKEMAQQGNCQSVLPADDQTKAVEAVRRSDAGSQVAESSQVARSIIEKAGIPRESRSSDGRPNRQGKGHRSWRQRTSTESPVQNLQDVNSSETSQNTQRSLEHQQNQKSDNYPGKEQPKYDQCVSLDGWGFPENPDSAVAQSAPSVGDQGPVAQGKRHAFKGNKGIANHDPDIRKTNGEAVKHMGVSILEMSQETVPSAYKENRNFGDRLTSHWQPKLSDQWGGAESGQSVGMVSDRSNKKDSSYHGKRSLPSRVEKEAAEGIAQHLKDQFVNEKRNVEEASDRAYQDPNKEEKSTLWKGFARSPSHGVTIEHSSMNTDNRHEQRSSSGFRKHGNQRSRLGKGHESRGDWSSSGTDMKNTSNWENQRQNMHFEYQPVGPQNNSRAHIPEGQKDTYHNSGTRFREKGLNQSRRGQGNFYGHQGGPVTREVVRTGAEES